MITCELGEKKYSIDFVSGRALREIGPALEMYTKIAAITAAVAKGDNLAEDQQPDINEAMDVMVKWFCVMFRNQFTPDEVYDSYPVDRLMHDVAFALVSVQTQMTQLLESFPTKAAETK